MAGPSDTSLDPLDTPLIPAPSAGRHHGAFVFPRRRGDVDAAAPLSVEEGAQGQHSDAKCGDDGSEFGWCTLGRLQPQPLYIPGRWLSLDRPNSRCRDGRRSGVITT
jgi:hypothetical protein